MKNFISALCLLIFTSVFVFAQTDDYKKGEVFVGYSNGQIDTGINSNQIPGVTNIDERETFNGFEASGVYNFNRYVGVKADFSGTYNNSNFDFRSTAVTGPTRVSFDADSSLYNILGGVQVKDNSTETRVKPFAHALVGAGIGRIKIKNFNCTSTVLNQCAGLQNTFDDTETGLAGAFGGGLDVKVNNRIDIRAIQFDYNPIRFNDSTQHNFRFGVGVVFK